MFEFGRLFWKIGGELAGPEMHVAQGWSVNWKGLGIIFEAKECHRVEFAFKEKTMALFALTMAFCPPDVTQTFNLSLDLSFLVCDQGDHICIRGLC